MTDTEKKQAINQAVTKHWDKMLADAKRITSYNYKLFEDLLPFVISEFLTKKDLEYQYKLCCIDNKLPNYIGRSMSLNLRSSTSPFWSKYRREGYNSRGTYLVEYDEFSKHEIEYLKDPDLTIEEMNPRECMYAALEQLHFYHKALVTDHFIHNMTFKELKAKYGITLNSLKKGVKEGIELIQQHCKHFNI